MRNDNTIIIFALLFFIGAAIGFVGGKISMTAECALLKSNAQVLRPGTYYVHPDCKDVQAMSFDNPSSQPVCLKLHSERRKEDAATRKER